MKITWDLFRFPFEGERWLRKMVIGGALVLGGIIFFPLMWPVTGYGLRVMRQTIQGEPPALPEWDDWSQLFEDGIRMWVVSLVYGLPGMILVCCAFGAWLMVIPSMAFIEDAPGVAVSGMIISRLLGIMVMGVSFIVSLPLNFLSYVAAARMVAHDSLSSAFEWGEVWGLAKAGLNDFLLSYAIWYGALMAVGMLGSILIGSVILACLYPLALGFMGLYRPLLVGALFGTAYHETQAKLAADQA